MFRLFLAVLVMLLTMGCPSPVLSAAEPAEAPSGKTVKAVLPPHEHRGSCETTSAEPVQIICILDRSGSMQKLTGDVIGGYNSFLANQRKEPGAAQVTTVLFDDRYETIVTAADLREAPELTSADYYARGTTALLDAIGRTITETLARMEKDNVCPAKRRVLFMIMTDGKENASREFDKATVKALIESTTEEYNWKYLFMGANIDSVAEAASLGIGANSALNYSHDSAGVRDSFQRMDEAAREAREGAPAAES